MLRTSIRGLLLNISDSKMVSRLIQEMVKVIQADITNVRGKRNVIDGEAELLEGFEFNKGSKLGTTLFAPYTGTIDRVAGTLTIDIPSFIPVNMVSAPGGATYYKIISAGTVVDFENETFEVETDETGEFPLDSLPTAVINMVNTVTANSVPPMFLALGIVFYQEVNGARYPLKNGAYNALSLVKVNGA